MATMPNLPLALNPQQVRVARWRPRRKAQRQTRKHHAKGAIVTAAIANRVNRAAPNESRHLAQALARVSRRLQANPAWKAAAGVNKPESRAGLNRGVLNRAAMNRAAQAAAPSRPKPKRAPLPLQRNCAPRPSRSRNAATKPTTLIHKPARRSMARGGSTMTHR